MDYFVEEEQLLSTKHHFLSTKLQCHNCFNQTLCWPNVCQPNSYWAKVVEQVEEINVIGKKTINETTSCQLMKQTILDITVRWNEGSTYWSQSILYTDIWLTQYDQQPMDYFVEDQQLLSTKHHFLSTKLQCHNFNQTLCWPMFVGQTDFDQKMLNR